ncbi:flagellar assembly protein FliW [Thermithiobacillus plumbiphilus]|uniref:Flagellar assembly protein FliW n=1 Tax=Thermithiobacillus plumbiphilus TaxID=1729899 RepID=A0ABU9DAN8_9PROT
MNRTIDSAQFGPLQISPDQILVCEEPLLGFEHLREFVLLEHPQFRPFTWLQSLESPELCFILAEARHFGLHYDLARFAPGQQGLSTLQLRVMVILPGNEHEPIRAHKLGPIWFDGESRRFGQRVVDATQVQDGVLSPENGQDGQQAMLPCMLVE